MLVVYAKRIGPPPPNNMVTSPPLRQQQQLDLLIASVDQFLGVLRRQNGGAAAVTAPAGEDGVQALTSTAPTHSNALNILVPDAENVATGRPMTAGGSTADTWMLNANKNMLSSDEPPVQTEQHLVSTSVEPRDASLSILE
jgi:hypothetical protein